VLFARISSITQPLVLLPFAHWWRRTEYMYKYKQLVLATLEPELTNILNTLLASIRKFLGE
jgi:hypothetical protein